MMKRVSIAIVALASSAGAAVAGDIAAGEKAFKKCMPCHTIGENAKNRSAQSKRPERTQVGSVAGYNYSDANKNSGIVWDEGTFKEYIKNPMAKIRAPKWRLRGLRTRRKRRFVELPRAVRTGRQEEMSNSALVAQKPPFGLRIGWQVKITTDDINDLSVEEL